MSDSEQPGKIIPPEMANFLSTDDFNVRLDKLIQLQQQNIDLQTKNQETQIETQKIQKAILRELKAEADEGEILRLTGTVTTTDFTIVNTITDPGHPIKAFEFTNDGNNSVYVGFNVVLSGEGADIIDVATNNTHFKYLSIQGDQEGETYYENCEVLILNNVHCQFKECALVGPIKMHSTWSDTTQIIDCYNGNATITPCIINHNNGNVNMRFSKYTGGIKFINITNPASEFSLAFSGGGRLSLDASDTLGTVRIYGNVIVEGTYGLTLEDISTGDVVWKHEYNANEYSSGTFGDKIGKKMLTIAKYLGLK